MLPEEDPNSGFDGFDRPIENWFRLPNNWTDLTAEVMTSWAEQKIVEYVIRHTWGYQDFDSLKRITLDEFMHGRKLKDGSRMDKGIGMEKQAVLAGIERAVEHGFLIVIKDSSDKARSKKFYGLKMKSSSVETIHPMYGEHTPRCMENIHRSEKETIERNYREKAPSRLKPSFEKHVDHQVGNGFVPDEETEVVNPVRGHSEVHEKFGIKLKKILRESDSGVCRDRNLKELSEGFRLLQKKDEKSEKEISQALDFLEEHIDKEWCPLIRSSKEFREKFPSLRKCMKIEASKEERGEYEDREISREEQRRLTEEVKRKTGYYERYGEDA